MRIVVMRHGQAEAYSGDDESRELVQRGRDDASNAGRCLAKEVPDIDTVWVSPFVRTQQTADAVLASFPHLQRQTKEVLISHEQPQRLLDELQQIDFKTILLISHNPLVSLLTAYLSGGQADRHISMQPASMALLSCDDLLPGCADLLWLRHAPTFDIA